MLSDTVIFGLPIGGYSNLEIAGLNLLLSWRNRFQSASLYPLSDLSSATDALRWSQIADVVENSEQFRVQFLKYLEDVDVSTPQALSVPYPVLHRLGEDLELSFLEKNTLLCGTPNIGFADFIITDLQADAVRRANLFSQIVAPSEWSKDILSGSDIYNVEVVTGGVDKALFFPHAKSDLFSGRFVVYSAGSEGYSGGYDLVLKAFELFNQAHPDSLLISSWPSRPFIYGEGIEPEDFTVSDNIIDIGEVPYSSRPYIIREADIAVFPSRASASNCRETECMACGIPVILSDNTSHKELIKGDNSLVLGSRNFIGGERFRGWSESDVEEILGALEFAYLNRDKVKTIGDEGCLSVSGYSWEAYADKIEKIIFSSYGS